MVEESDWNSNVDLAFQDHSYSTQIKVAAKECVLYYICGYVSKQIRKHTKCNVCLSAFKGILFLYNILIDIHYSYYKVSMYLKLVNI